MTITSARHRAALALALISALVLTVLLAASAPADARRPAGKRSTVKPTIVLVHGSWADASSWRGEIRRLQQDGYPVVAPAVPLRGIASDARYVSEVVNSIPGPVVLVGHSYGGAVVTSAATNSPRVKALVYINAFGLAENESILDIVSRFPGSDLATAIVPRPFTNPDGSTGIDLYIEPEKFHEIFAQDLSARKAAVLAATQRPMTEAALVEKSGPPAWSTIPSWYMVSRQDHAIPPAAERFMAQRMGAHTVEIDASHAAPISKPEQVTRLIEAAAAATAG